ncbi:hypothetical protein BSYN_18580 [Bacteroides sedimenti]|uniref:Lipoprotein n=1 Tax=Bacteroides sedimenti TaxID=2136147 RepID=A0ABM8IC97_9BACE
MNKYPFFDKVRLCIPIILSILLFTSCSDLIYGTADVVYGLSKIFWFFFKIGLVIIGLWIVLVILINVFGKK